MSSNEYILKLENVSKSFGGVKAVNCVTMLFEKNKITGLIGPNGAGKTTIFNLVNGFITPDSGEIWYKNQRIDNLPSYKIAQLGIGRLFQDVRVFNKLTVLENVLIAIPNQIGEKFYENIFKRRKMLNTEKENIKTAEQLLEIVGLIDKRNVYAENLSYGQQKLLSIARLLAMGTELLLLDEPTSGVHPSFIEKILELIKNLPKNGKTVIFIEHNINVVLEIADWVYLLDEGQVFAFGLPDEVLHDKVTKEVYLVV